VRAGTLNVVEVGQNLCRHVVFEADVEGDGRLYNIGLERGPECTTARRIETWRAFMATSYFSEF
jgi:hypothetical protein